jgi:hypothetical protein
METRLNLLMRDGALAITFPQKLTAEQYAELLDAVTKPSTRDHLRSAVKSFADTWRMDVDIDDA